uniref:BRISC complex subunit Abro1 n=2 Tax=Parasteatoda tepidariorum TaxID=114398 RepID=A0A2L2Y6Z2_PARTP
MCNTEEDLMISVFSAYPCGSFLSFYDSKGVINLDFIKNFLGDRIKSVIGWYRFRRNVPPYPSAREAIVHRNLMRAFSGNLAIGDNFFIYGVFGSSASESGATHTYDYAFYVERPDRFVPLVMSMLNLIDTKTKYRSGSLASSFVNSQTFDSVLNIAWSFESCWQTEDGIQQMHKLLRDKCSNLAEELTASECVNATIEEDVFRLEAELESLTMSDKQSFVTWNDEFDDQENVENIPPYRESKNIKPTRKRYWSEVIDFENEKRHSVYGKYFEQNKAQDPQESSESGYYIPPKKLKVLQEHKRVIDHDYSSASDDAQEMDDKADDMDGHSETEDSAYDNGAACAPTESVLSEIKSESSLDSEREEKPKMDKDSDPNSMSTTSNKSEENENMGIENNNANISGLS